MRKSDAVRAWIAAAALLLVDLAPAQTRQVYSSIDAAALKAPARRTATEAETTLQFNLMMQAVAALQNNDFAATFTLAKRILAEEERIYGNDHPQLIKTLELVGAAETLRGRPREASIWLERALAIATRWLDPRAPDLLGLLHAHATNLQETGRLEEADSVFRRVLDSRSSVLGSTDPETLDTLAGWATNLELLGRADEAEPLFERGLKLAIEHLGERHLVAMKLLNGRATNLENLERSEEAAPLFAHSVALRTAVHGADSAPTLSALNNQARNLMSLLRWSEAEPLLARVVANGRVRWGDNHRETLYAMLNHGWALLKIGRVSEAEPLTRAASDGLANLLGPTHGKVSIAWNNLALSRLLMNQSTLALAPARAAAEGTRTRLATGGSGIATEVQYLRDARDNMHVFTVLADADWANFSTGKGSANLREEGFKALQDSMIGATSQAVAFAVEVSLADGQNGAISALLRERNELKRQWVALDYQLTASVAFVGPDAAPIHNDAKRRLKEIENLIASIESRLRAHSAAYATLGRPAAMTIADAQAALDPGEAALMVVPTLFGSHVVALTESTFHWHRADDLNLAEVDELVARLRADLDLSPGATANSFDRKAAHRLYTALISPARSTLSGAKRVYIAANGTLATLPFGVLVSEEPQGSDSDPSSLRDTHWFADDHALVQLPSLHTLSFMRRLEKASKRSALREPFAGFGAPLLQGRPARLSFADRGGLIGPTRPGRFANVARLRELPGLPRSIDELEQLRAVLGAPASAVRAGAAATETEVRGADLSTTAILAFATHGLMPGEGGVNEPGLVLTPPPRASAVDDGLLTMSEIASLRLDADLVILSACNTAGGALGAEPGLSGLARAFFTAGARGLLASHWRIRDDIAARITVETVMRHRETGARGGYAEALQAAMRSIRMNSQNRGWAHPAMWGPFVVIGDVPRRVTEDS